MRLIDADELKEHVKKYTSVFAKYDWREICEMLNDAPTVDPVKHGHWINDNGIYKCTVCNSLCLVAGWASCIPEKQMYKVFKFCPYCGAKMDEVTDAKD